MKMAVDEKNRDKKLAKATDMTATKKTVKPPAKPELAAEQQKKVEKSLRTSIHEGILNAAASSIFTTFVIPLALALKATNLQIGFLNTAQNIASTAGQVPGAKLTEYYNRKTIWTICQIIAKVVVWIPIMLLPFMKLDDPVAALIIFASLSSFFLAMRGPAWASLMGDLVPTERRGAYFGKRNMVTGFSGIAVTLAAGFLLAWFGFSLIFLIGIAISIISIPIFMRMHEPSTKRVFHYRHVFALRPDNWGMSIKLNMKLVIFTVYMTAFNFASEIASPYYVVYMLKNLSISYEVFAALTVAGALVRILSFKYWGYFNDKFGSRNILIITGFFAIFTPFGWLFVSNAWHILLVKIFDGFIWAGFDQVVFNYLLDITPADKRPQYIANHSFFAGLGVILGAVTGGLLSEALQGSTFLWFAGLQIVFLISFVLRIIAAGLLAKIKDADIRQSQVMPVRYVFWRTMAVEPATGLKNMIHFTFRYPFNRDEEYLQAIRRKRWNEHREKKLEKKKNAIIEGAAEAFKPGQDEDGQKDGRPK